MLLTTLHEALLTAIIAVYALFPQVCAVLVRLFLGQRHWRYSTTWTIVKWALVAHLMIVAGALVAGWVVEVRTIAGLSVNAVFWSIVLPSPLVAIVAGLTMFKLEHDLRVRAAGGRCEKCGYDLAGINGAKCPECGTGQWESLLLDHAEGSQGRDRLRRHG